MISIYIDNYDYTSKKGYDDAKGLLLYLMFKAGIPYEPRVLRYFCISLPLPFLKSTDTEIGYLKSLLNKRQRCEFFDVYKELEKHPGNKRKLHTTILTTKFDIQISTTAVYLGDKAFQETISGYNEHLIIFDL
jgi:hypothetical protein